MTFEDKVTIILDELKATLLAKNKKYGNSALEPVRVFSKASPKEQILVRLDDKLSRLRTQHISEDEDVSTDLMGYLVLLKIADMEDTQALDDRIEKYEDSTLYDKIHMGIEGFNFDESYEMQIRTSLRKSAYYLYEYNKDGSMSIHSRSEGKHNIHFDNYDEFKAWQNNLKKDNQ